MDQVIEKKIKRNILLNPGPATTSTRVKMALLQPDLCPREKEFALLLKDVRQKILKVVAAPDSFDSVLIPGPGTASIESTLLSMNQGDKKILIIENGAYGKRMQDICDVYGIKYLPYKLSWDVVVNCDELEAFIQKHQTEIGAMAFVHHETTSGLINPLSEIVALAQKYKLVSFVDAMSSYAGVDIDLTKTPVDYLVSSSNKCIQGMAGYGFVIFNKSVLDGAKTKRQSFSLDLRAQYLSQKEKEEFLFTAPVQILYALDEALDEFFEEGPLKRYERYAKLYQTMLKGMRELGFKSLMSDDTHSKILTTFIEPNHPNYSFDSMHDYLYEHDITIYPGKIPVLNSFRISNIGELNIEDIEYFLSIVKKYKEHQNIEEFYS